jgi:sec-independent protein translocase protein TatC
MVIAYRINNYGWLIFFLTVGIGILAMIPVSMLLFHHGNLVTYGSMRNRWREVTLGILGAAAFLSPRGVFTMFLIGLPVVGAYLVGLWVLWVVTLGGRRSPEPAEPAD